MSDEDTDPLRGAIARHVRDVLRFLTRWVGARDAPDLAQETFLRVLGCAERDVVANPASLLRATAANLARDHARRRRTESKYVVHGLTLDDLFGAAPSPAARLEAEESLTRASSRRSTPCRPDAARSLSCADSRTCIRRRLPAGSAFRAIWSRSICARRSGS